MTHHLLIAHGSPDPRHKAMMRTLAGMVDDRGLPCSAAYLEHDSPGVPQALGALTGPVVTLGMLLAPGFHATVDVRQGNVSEVPDFAVVPSEEGKVVFHTNARRDSDGIGRH
jgi:hypothetical protein